MAAAMSRSFGAKVWTVVTAEWSCGIDGPADTRRSISTVTHVFDKHQHEKKQPKMAETVSAASHRGGGGGGSR